MSKNAYVPSNRQLKVGELIKQELALLFLSGKYSPYLKDQSVTVSEVRVTVDLQIAYIYVFPFGGKLKGDELLEILKSITPPLKSSIAKRVNLKYFPDFVFHIDDSFDQYGKINNILKHIEVDELTQ